MVDKSLSSLIPAETDYTQLMWGTRGKDGTEPLKWVRLCDCSREHLEAILATQPQIKGTVYEIAIKTFLER